MSSGIEQWTKRDLPTMNVSWRSNMKERPLREPCSTSNMTRIASFRDSRMTRVVSPVDLIRESMDSIAIVFASAAAMNYHPASDTWSRQKCDAWTGDFVNSVAPQFYLRFQVWSMPLLISRRHTNLPRSWILAHAAQVYYSFTSRLWTRT